MIVSFLAKLHFFVFSQYWVFLILITLFGCNQSSEPTPSASAPVPISNNKSLPLAYETIHTSDALRRATAAVNYPIVDRFSKQELNQWQAEQAARYSLDSVIAIDTLGIYLVFIPQGRFFWGDNVGFGSDDELPVIDTMVDTGFIAMQHEVTWSLWHRCIKAKYCRGGAVEGDDKNTANIPVVNVSLTQIQQQFIPWLYTVTGVKWQLPTELLWEYMARAGSQYNYPWGETISRANTNYGAGICCSYKSLHQDQWLYAAPVGQFPANAWQLYDVTGNVSEWTRSCYTERLSVKPLNQCTSKNYVTKGGSWYHPPNALRLSNRSPYSGDSQLIYLGFRLITSIEAVQVMLRHQQPIQNEDVKP